MSALLRQSNFARRGDMKFNKLSYKKTGKPP